MQEASARNAHGFTRQTAVAEADKQFAEGNLTPSTAIPLSRFQAGKSCRGYLERKVLV